MQKKFKWISAVILCIGLIFTVCGCGNPTPSETVDAFLTALKTQDEDALKSVYAEDDFDLLSNIEEDDSTEAENDDALDALLEEQLKDKLFDFDYTISNEQISNTNATVDVEFKTYEFGEAMKKSISTYLEKALPLAFNGASEEEISHVMNEALQTEFGALKEKNYTQTAAIELTQEDGVWKVKKIDPEGNVMNALSGNLVKTASELSSSFDE